MELQTVESNVSAATPQSFALTNLPETAQKIVLGKNMSHHMSGSRRGEILACEKGRVWITQERDPHDYVINSGEAFWVTLPGRVVLKALAESVIRVSKSIKQKPFSGGYRSSVFK